MHRFNLEVPDDLEAQMKRRANELGYAKVEEYITSLIRDDTEQSIDYGAPRKLRAGSREQLEAMLLEAKQSPTRDMTRADWENKKHQLIEEFRVSKAG